MTTKASIGKDSNQIRETLLYLFGGALLIGGTVYFGRKILMDALSNHEEKKSLDEGSAASYAKRIKMAFDNDGWIGTDENELRNVIREIPSQQAFLDVTRSYQKLYSKVLMKDMSDELSTSEYNEMVQIIYAKPQRTGEAGKSNYLAWAKRLHAAFSKTYGFFPATDEDAIRAVFMEIPSQSAYREVENAYWEEYGVDMLAQLKSELEFWEIDEYLEIIASKQP